MHLDLDTAKGRQFSPLFPTPFAHDTLTPWYSRADSLPLLKCLFFHPFSLPLTRALLMSIKDATRGCAQLRSHCFHYLLVLQAISLSVPGTRPCCPASDVAAWRPDRSSHVPFTPGDPWMGGHLLHITTDAPHLLLDYWLFIKGFRSTNVSCCFASAWFNLPVYFCFSRFFWFSFIII